MIKDTDRGYKKLLTTINKAGVGTVEVGILTGEGNKESATPGLTLYDVAMFNEFGLGVPERSFIRGYVDENKGQVQKWSKILAEQVLAGKLTTAQALELLGMKVQGGIQKRIADGIDPENKPSTIKRKGSSTPLIDTGQLRSAISYRVKE